MDLPLSAKELDSQNLHLGISKFRANFRVWFSILFVAITVVTFFLPPTTIVPFWYQMAMFPVALGSFHLGYLIKGDVGAAYLFSIASIGLAIGGLRLGDGFMTQPVQIFLLPVFASILGGPWATAFSFSASAALIYGSYVWQYVLGNPAPKAFDYDSWVTTSFPYQIFAQLIIGFLIPLIERMVDAPVHLLKEIAEESRKSDMTRESTTVARDALAAFSHEVRTPLNVVHAMADLLLRSGEVLSEHYTSLIHLLHSCAQSLLVISNNVLDLSAIWANALTVNPGKFDVESVLSEWLSVSRESANVRGLEISYEFVNDAGGLRFASFDEGRLKQILHNVLDHTVRRAKQGGKLSISVRLTVQDWAMSLHASIHSPDETLTEEQAKKMFRLPFSDESSGVSERVDLDMYIARKLTRALKGTIVCSCQPTGGVMYSLTIPMALPEDVEETAKSLRILYADDEPTNQFVMRVLLKDSGHQLDLADDGDKAFDMFKEINGGYDAVLLDMNMPRMGGKETAKAIRSLELQEKYIRTPIAFISAAPVHQHDVIESGADFVLQKPCSKAQLLAFFTSVANKPRTPQTPSASTDASATTSPENSDDEELNEEKLKRALSVLEEKKSQSLRARVESLMFPANIPPRDLVHYFAAVLVATVSFLSAILSILFPPVCSQFRQMCFAWSTFPVYLSFVVYPLFSADILPRRLLSVYAPVQTTFMLLHTSFLESGYPTYYLYSSILFIYMLSVGTNRLGMLFGILMHASVGVLLLYIQANNLYQFPDMMGEREIAFAMIIFWPLSMLQQTLYSLSMEHQRRNAISGLMTAHNQLIAKQRKVSRQQHAMLELSAHVSYDIRTPLNAVLGITDRLKDAQDLPESIRQSAGVLDTAGGMLLLLLDNVVDAKRVEAGDQLTLQMEKVNLRSLGRRIATMMAFYARGKKLRLLLRIGQAVPASVLVDELRLQQVIVNLLTNSIKFTTQGSVTVTIENAAVPNDEMETIEATTVSFNARFGLPQTRDSLKTYELLHTESFELQDEALQGSTESLPRPMIPDDRMPIRISVSDSGPGIDAVALTKIFGQYQAGISVATRKKRGSGLGLYISQAIVKKFGGELKVRSMVGVGSRFYFTLPLTCVTSNDILSPHTPEEDSSSTVTKLRVLCVEDAPEMQYIVKLFLSDTPHALELVSTATEAIKCFRERPFDVILLDQHLPDLSGPQAAQKIRALPGGARVIIAAVTADATEKAKFAAINAGCDNFLSKPLSRVSLMNLLRGAADTLSLKDSDKARLISPLTLSLPLPSVTPVQSSRSSVSEVEVTKSLVSTVTNQKEIIRVPESFYEYVTSVRVPTLKEELNQMLDMLTKGDLRSVQQAAHKIRGSAGTFGLVKIGDLTTQIERSSDVELARTLVQQCVESLANSELVITPD